ncbi:hypothetical protein [Synergistes jonesii]|uniref:hypothetical protein n=1 Tax=Synergistes jonesii TaxID=2754 RepID=UPI00331B0B2B
MENPEVEEKHLYRCAECGLEFASGGFAEQCPQCRCRVLIHVKGEARRGKKSCCTGSCAGCGGCSH